MLYNDKSYRTFLNNLSFLFYLFPDSSKILKEVRRSVAKKLNRPEKSLSIQIDISNFKSRDYLSNDMCIEFMGKLYSGGLNIIIKCNNKTPGYKQEDKDFLNIYFVPWNDFWFCFAANLNRILIPKDKPDDGKSS